MESEVRTDKENTYLELLSSLRAAFAKRLALASSEKRLLLKQLIDRHEYEQVEELAQTLIAQTEEAWKTLSNESKEKLLGTL